MKTTGWLMLLMAVTFSTAAADFSIITNGPAYAISADGSSVIGQYNGITYGAGYRWQFPNNVITLLGTADPRQQTQAALAVDAHGGVAVGYVYHSYPTPPFGVYNSKIWGHIDPNYNFAGSGQL